LQVSSRAVVGIHDEAIYADALEMIHCVSHDGPSSDLQEGLRTPLRQRAKARPQASGQDEGSLESPFSQWHLTRFFQ
jgi:hypothetical protein